MSSPTKIWLSIATAILFFAQTSKANHPAWPLQFNANVFPSLAELPDSNDNGKLKYPIKDRSGDFVTDSDDNPFNLKDPPAIEQTVEYDPVTNSYIVTETIGGFYVKPPTYYTYDEYLQYTLDNEMEEYWDSRSDAINILQKSNLIPPIELTRQKTGIKIPIEIRPQGNIDLTIGGNFQKIGNPTLPIQQRKQGSFDFDMDINMNVLGKIGDFVQVNFNYNTKATFDFDNQIKLEYTGDEDDIIQEFKAGNVDFPLNTQLIQGSQALFGFKPTLRFGRLTWSSVISEQKSKKQSIVLEGGAQTQKFSIDVDQYDENRHFFLSQFFRDQYNKALSDLPIINTLVDISKVEVWVTNQQGTTENVRDIVAFMDLGDGDPYSNQINTFGLNKKPDNAANDLYGRLKKSDAGRSINAIEADLQTRLNLTAVQDFAKTYAKKLSPSEYTLHPQLGYVSLNSTLQPDEVLAVAFEYTFNGQKFKVGEFGYEVPPDSASGSKVLYLKMLKSTSVRPNLPIWDLMMKNIYSLGAFQIGQEDFKLDIYYNDPGQGVKRFLPKGNLKGIPLIRLLNLDNLNNQNDAQPDGIFDFVPGVTINPQRGKLIFPVVEPFGDDLRDEFEAAGEPDLADQFVYDQLYDSTRVIAQQFPEFNRFSMRGEYKGNNSSDISLGAFNIPKNSVSVSMGGQKLVEGVHYTVDYNLGRIKIIDESIVNSGNQIKVDFENNALFGFQVKSLFGTRLDYKISDNFNIGGTIMKLKERPFTQKVNIGDDPISNSIMGLDLNYKTEAPFLTRALDKLPLYDTKEISTIGVTAEVAHLRPGHSKAISSTDNEGVVYLDDFEGTSSGYDLKFPALAWKLSSTPRNSKSSSGNILFPEADEIDDLDYGKNRALMAWYNIDPVFQRNTSATPQYIKSSPCNYINHYTKEIRQEEVFPNRDNTDFTNTTILTFDVSFFPNQRGPYNFDVSRVNNDGTLQDPRSRWGGIMRNIDNSDFEASNVEFIEFWVLDPFIDDASPQREGSMYINLGNLSEDILRDSRMSYENGLKANLSDMDKTEWARVPKIPPITNSFDTDPNSRAYQDVGFDGVDDIDESTHYSDFFQAIPTTTWNQNVKDNLSTDPASDNYLSFRAEEYDDIQEDIVERYKYYNNPDGNSPIAGDNDVFSQAATFQPDIEDFNRDNSLSTTEEYFQYEIPIYPNMDVDNHPYIVSKSTNPGYEDQLNNCADNRDYNWYQFKIPIREYDSKVGNIQDFKSIQFIRMFLTGFADSLTMRFATFDLIRNQWRTYQFNLDESIDNVQVEPEPEAVFNVSSVSLEENSEKEPVNYVLPPDIERESGVGTTSSGAVLLNEQSLAINVCDLADGESKAVYKTLDLDFRNYKKLKMFVHAEAADNQSLGDGEITAFIRLGSDFKDNYYQYEVPLTITAPAPASGYDPVADRRLVWPLENEFDLVLEDLINVKIKRNSQSFPANVPFKVIQQDPNDPIGKILTVVGNPDLGLVKTVMIGIKNPAKDDPNNPLVLFYNEADDGLPKCAELWYNELRLSGLDEESGTAALASVNMKLADLGNIQFSTSMHTIGFGQLEQQVDDRFQDRFFQYDLSSNIELGKFLPEKWGIRIPFYGSISQSFSTPEYDPYQLDVPFENNFDTIKANFGVDSARGYRQSVQEIVTRKGFNFTNVRIIGSGKGKPRFYSPSNFNFTYAYNVIEKSDPYVASDRLEDYLGALGYNFSPTPKYINPFKNAIKSKSKWFDIIKDINLNFIPSNFGFNTQLNRQFGELRLRSFGEDVTIEPTYNKFFTWNRNYTFKYNPFKSLSIDFTASNRARIDEPLGRIDTKDKKKELWDNLKSFGRTTNYNHSTNINYNVPINKIPILSWIKVKAGYNSTYTWTTAPQVKGELPGELVLDSRGNTISNSQNFRLNNDFNFKSLYDKSDFLKQYNKNAPPKTKEDRQKQIENITNAREKIKKDIERLKQQLAVTKKKIKEVKKDDDKDPVSKEQELATLKSDKKKLKKNIKEKKKDKKKKQLPVRPGVSAAVKPLLALKKITVNYTENKGTTVAGYLPKTKLFGLSDGFGEPGWKFVLGEQPGQSMFKSIDAQSRNEWLDNLSQDGFISTDTLLNQRFTQSWSKQFDMKMNFEPFNDFRIDLNWKRNFSQNHSQLYKVTSEGGDFEHLNAIDIGSYAISFFTWGTAFEQIDSTGISNGYRAFENNRKIISQRLQEQNANSIGSFVDLSEENPTIDTNYASGYGPTSQDVLIPAFIAAYTGKEATTSKLNPINYIPKPNWRITYNGLAKMPWAKDLFQSITISHGYTSELRINNYETNLDYDGGGGYLEPAEIDTLNGNFYTLYRIPNIVISEQLSPLIGIDVSMKNNVSAKFEFKKTRTLSMSFIDYQLRETKSKTITVGLGYKVRGLTLPIKRKGKFIRLQNDLNFKFDLSVRDNVTVNHRLDQNSSEPTQGSKNISINPSIDYTVNKRLNLRIFFDRIRTIPKTSASFPTTNTKAGVTISFSLTQ
ncbi:MAG: cell surface protein SprA [Chitinophagales bacterium]|nr:cell surface protein SprA [Chitinophagales bacterium]